MERRDEELYRVQREYFNRIGIRTVAFAYESFATSVVENLLILRRFAILPEYGLEIDQIEGAIQYLAGNVYRDPVYLVAANAEGRFALPEGAGIEFLYHAIWTRRIPIDLYRRFDPGRRMREESRSLYDELRAKLL
jgi:hypothetical protein